MSKLTNASLVAVLTAALTGAAIASPPADVKGSRDHPLFPKRMAGYSISLFQLQEFGSYEFRTRPPQTIDGRHTRITYYLGDPQRHPGGIAIKRNYENALKAAGGVVLHSDDNVSVMKVTHKGVETWAEVQASNSYAGRVMSAIVAAGIRSSRIDAVGHGQDRPVGDNRTEEGRASNRRVEIVKR